MFKTAQNNTKTLTIGNYKGNPTVSQEYIASEWGKVETAIQQIQNCQKPNDNCEDLYRCVENLCTHNQKDIIFENLQRMIQDYLSARLDVLVLASNNFLECLNLEWTKFHEQITLIKNIFLYTDRKNKAKYNNIYTTSIQFFKTMIVMNTFLKSRITTDLQTQVEDERNGKDIDRKLMKNLLCVMNELQVYEIIFKDKFLENTRTFYESEGKKIVSSCSIYEYLCHTKNRIQEEKARMANYLDQNTGNGVLELLYEHLITKHIKTILGLGFAQLLDKNELKELASLYSLLSLISDGLNHLESSFTIYIIKQGTAIVMNTENDKNMIQELLDFKSKINAIVKESFSNNDKFQNAVRTSFAQFINKRQSKPAELLAKYVDLKMRRKDLPEEHTETILQSIMVLFRLIQGKDIFEAFYKANLAKRLLLGRSTSQDIEKSMLSKLKEECGGNYTAKLEGMFKDINISNSINTSFKQYLTHLEIIGDGSQNQADLTINVLTSSYWPSYRNYNVNLPAELVKYQQIFQKFYQINHSGRKLLWQPNLGHCIVKAGFKNSNKELQVSLFQAMVLLLFNDSIKLSYSEIKELTCLEEIELKRTLLSLACGKARVLFKSSKGIDIEDSDEFSLNEDFNNKLFRIKINQIQLKETQDEQKATHESVMNDRQFQIDAAIVRIMKNYKVLHHNVLMTQLYQVLDIPMEPTSLKKRIEQLIERDYIERDKDNPACYKYIA